MLKGTSCLQVLFNSRDGHKTAIIYDVCFGNAMGLRKCIMLRRARFVIVQYFYDALFFRHKLISMISRENQAIASLYERL